MSKDAFRAVNVRPLNPDSLHCTSHLSAVQPHHAFTINLLVFLDLWLSHPLTRTPDSGVPAYHLPSDEAKHIKGHLPGSWEPISSSYSLYNLPVLSIKFHALLLTHD